MRDRYFYITDWLPGFMMIVESVEEHAREAQSLIVSFQVLEDADRFCIIALMEPLEEE